MAVISCPECSKKLKIADTSVGKKVKCSCGNVFVAETEAEAAAPAPPPKKAEAPAPAPPPKKAAVAVTPEKVFVSCTECEAKLKVATTSLGKKMKCPKCASVFVAAIEEDAPPAPAAKNMMKATPKPPITEDDDEEETPKPKPKAKGKPANDDDEMDALFGFAQADASNNNEDGLPSFEDEDEEELPKSKAKPAKKPGKRPQPFDDEGDEDEDDADESPRRKKAKAAPPVYPRRTVLNIFVLTLVTLYIAFFLVVYLDLGIIQLGTKRLANQQRPDLTQNKKKNEEDKKIEEKKNEEKKITPPSISWQDRFLARQKEEMDWLEAIRKNPRPDVPNVIAILSTEAAMIDEVAFSPAAPILASAARANEKEGIKLWDLKTGKATKTIPVELKSVTMLRFSPDGTLLAVLSGEEKSLKVWKVADGSEVKSFTLEEAPQEIAFDFNSKRLMMTTAQATDVKIWDVADWKESKFNAKTQTGIFYLLSPGGDKVVAPDEMKKLIAVHNLETGEIKNVPCEKSINPTGSAISANGRILVCKESQDGSESILTFDLETGVAGTVVQAKNVEFTSPRCSPDGKFISFGIKEEDWKTKLVEIAPKKERSVFPGESPLTFSDGGVFVARIITQDDKASIQLMAFEDLIAQKKVEEKKKDEDKKTEEKKKDEDKKTEEKKKDEDKKTEGKKVDEKKGDDKKDKDRKEGAEKKGDDKKGNKIEDKKKDDDKKDGDKKKDEEKSDLNTKDSTQNPAGSLRLHFALDFYRESRITPTASKSFTAAKWCHDLFTLPGPGLSAPRLAKSGDGVHACACSRVPGD